MARLGFPMNANDYSGTRAIPAKLRLTFPQLVFAVHFHWIPESSSLLTRTHDEWDHRQIRIRECTIVHEDHSARHARIRPPNLLRVPARPYRQPHGCVHGEGPDRSRCVYDKMEDEPRRSDQYHQNDHDL